MNILVISGSLRAGSYNTALAKAFKALAPAGVSAEVLDPAELGALPLFNQDMEASFPEAVTKLKDSIKAADAIIVATPEYNRSIPGPLKNFVDWTSRPYGDAAWKGKHVFIAGATGGIVGTALAQYALKQVMLYLDALVIGQPEFYLSGAQDKFDAEGNLIDEKTKEAIGGVFATLAARVNG